METKFFLAILALLVGVSLVSSATYEGNFDVNTGGDTIIIGGETCQEDWSGFWTTCQNETQTFACTDTNACGTENLKPAQCGEVRACETAPEDTNTNTGSGGGGSGGSGGVIILSDTNDTIVQENLGNGGYTCAEIWDCTDWSDSENSCGTRTCTDVNECRTEELKPLEEKECTTTSIWPINGFVTGVSNFIKASPGKSLISVIILVIIIVALVTLTSKTSKAVGEKLGAANAVEDELAGMK